MAHNFIRGLAVLTIALSQGCTTVTAPEGEELRVVEVDGADFVMKALSHESDVVEIRHHDEHVVCFYNCPTGRKGLHGDVVWVYFADPEPLDLSPTTELIVDELDRETVASKNFRFDSSRLVGNLEGLKRVAAAAKENPEALIVIEGHTDSVGKKKYNVGLSYKRATAVAVWLMNQGISPKRMKTHGFGEAKPVASNETAGGREKNRRAEVILRIKVASESDMNQESESSDAGN